tara:strand:- start:31719 stop:33578 length:1860 start_codon:yes stop_codon:yes gene_type:complete
MHKIIFDTFEFDLTPYDISIVEDNQWFTGEFYFNYSFPFNFKLTDDLIAVFGELLDDNAKFIQSKYDVTYVFGNKMYPSTFEIESNIGKEVEATFRYGLEAFPLWDKKLRDFNFPTFSVADIYDHAKTLLDRAVGVNDIPEYEFPLINTNKYDTEDVTWSTFLGVINNYDGSASEYVENTHLPEDFANRNIMQPCLYWYYVLHFCFLEAGFTLKGDIISYTLFRKILLYSSTDFFNRVTPEAITIQLALADQVQETALAYEFDSDFNLAHSKKYKVTGDIYINTPLNESGETYYFKMFYNGVLIDEAYKLTPRLRYIKKGINKVFETTTDDTINHILTIEIVDYKFTQPTNREFLANLKVEQIIDGAAQAPDEIQNLNTINLKKALPDVTFGALIEQTTKFFNLERTIIGKEIHFNFIEDQINYDDAVDLSEYLVLKPKKTLNKNPSYLFKYKGDSENEDIVYVDKDDVFFTDDKVSSTTEIIELALKPMQFDIKNDIFTVTDQGDISESDICLIVYDYSLNRIVSSSFFFVGFNIYNKPQSNEQLSLLSIYETFYQNFLFFLFNAINYEWVFKMYAEILTTINKKVFAYNRYHIVKSLEKTQISKDLFEVQIETETLE